MIRPTNSIEADLFDEVKKVKDNPKKLVELGLSFEREAETLETKAVANRKAIKYVNGLINAL